MSAVSEQARTDAVLAAWTVAARNADQHMLFARRELHPLIADINRQLRIEWGLIADACAMEFRRIQRQRLLRAGQA